MPSILVQKFGGSSVADASLMRLCARRTIDERERGRPVVVVVSAMGDATDDLIALADTARADAAERDPEAQRELDQLLATGEQAAAAMMALVLRSLGVPALSLTGAQAGIVTDGRHGAAQIIRVDTARVLALVQRGIVPVITGFQGLGIDGDVCTLGRGGSDTTAVALAVALRSPALA